ncbi:MAG TPA: amidohydrolase family protein, partial [Acidimicrobiales bacterium]|nr:amidohydrolase family protein [Acidimicrobiales bacterium]
MDRYLVISADTHAGPPTERYRDYLDPKYREAFDADREATKFEADFRREALGTEDFEERWEQETGDSGRRASWDPGVRNTELDREGIAAEVIFPDADVLSGGASAPFHAGLGSSGDLDGDLVLAGAIAHNRWLSEICSDSPERRCGVATVPILHDVRAALAEIERVAGEGFRAMMIPTLWGDKPSYNDPVYEPIWAACEDAGVVLHIHSGGAAKDVTPGPGMFATFATEAWFYPARPMWLLLWSGAFDRHPGLRFALTEDGAWWLPGIVKRMDEKWFGGHNTAKLGNAFREHVSRPPSEYFGTNIFLGASTPSREEIERRHEIGVDVFMWGNDFPHPEGTWPHTRESIREAFFD